MTKFFTVRVELHGAAWQDYETLHAAMTKEGFSRQIVGTDGVTYDLPTAEYIIVGEYTIEQITEKASRAAAKTGKSAGVFVAETVRWMWRGLRPARKAA